MTLVFSILYNMKRTMTSKEIANYVNEQLGMDICHPDGDGDVRIDTDKDYTGNDICCHDYIFCDPYLYRYVNQQGFTMDNVPDITINSYSADTEYKDGYKCFNPEQIVEDMECRVKQHVDVVDTEWAFDMECFENVIVGLKRAFKVPEQEVILSDDEEFVV